MLNFRRIGLLRINTIKKKTCLEMDSISYLLKSLEDFLNFSKSLGKLLKIV